MPSQTLSCPFNLAELPVSSYLVGGWVRDRLLGRNLELKNKIDLDFVMPQGAVETASAIAKRYQAGFVLLDPKRQIARVVFSHATADFAQQVGDSISADLAKRDFCMNAIALNCQNLLELPDLLTPEMLIDPWDGQGDLQRRQVRMVAPENLQADPLRILRAYRQSAQLGFEIEALTRTTVIALAPNLANVAAERVRTELFYLLSAEQGSLVLAQAVTDGILQSWLPNLVIDLERFSKIDRAIALLKALNPNLVDYFATELAGDRNLEIVTKLTALVKAANSLECLGLSKAEQKFSVNLLRYLPQCKQLLGQDISPQAQYQLFQATMTTFPALVALAIADGIELELVIPWLQRWLDPQDAIAHPPVLITGDDLRNRLNLSPSPQIGELLEQVRLAQVAGIIGDAEAAIAYVAKLLEKLVN